MVSAATARSGGPGVPREGEVGAVDAAVFIVVDYRVVFGATARGDAARSPDEGSESNQIAAVACATIANEVEHALRDDVEVNAAARRADLLMMPHLVAPT